MRRLLLVLSMALVVASLAAPAVATTDAPGEVALLAAPAGDPAGPDPQPRDAEGNPAGELGAYEELETPFTWAASFLLLFAGVVGLVLFGGLYYLLVHRPAREREHA